MTIWQSLALVSPAQWAYALALAALFAWRGPSPVLWLLLADFLAILAISAAMDFGFIDETEAHWSMLVVWVAVVAVLATIPGVGRVMAGIGVLCIAFFALSLRFSFQFDATSAIVNASAFLMLAVAAYGLGDGGGSGRGRADRPLSADPLAGDLVMAAGGLARRADVLSQDGGRR